MKYIYDSDPLEPPGFGIAIAFKRGFMIAIFFWRSSWMIGVEFYE